MRALLFLILALSANAAQITLAWDRYPDAVEYLLWSGPASGDYNRAAFTTNTTITVTNLVAGQLYRFGLTAYSRTNASLTATLTAAPRDSILFLEWAPSATGPWQVKTSLVVVAEPGFYRGRLELR